MDVTMIPFNNFIGIERAAQTEIGQLNNTTMRAVFVWYVQRG